MTGQISDHLQILDQPKTYTCDEHGRKSDTDTDSQCNPVISHTIRGIYSTNSQRETLKRGMEFPWYSSSDEESQKEASGAVVVCDS